MANERQAGSERRPSPEALLERETISGKEFKTLMEGGTLPPMELETPKKAAKAAPKPAAEPASEEVQGDAAAAFVAPPPQEGPQPPVHTDTQA